MLFITKQLKEHDELIEMEMLRYIVYVNYNNWIQEPDTEILEKIEDDDSLGRERDKYDDQATAYLGTFVKENKVFSNQTIPVIRMVVCQRIIHRYNEHKKINPWMMENEYENALEKFGIQLSEDHCSAEISRMAVHPDYMQHMVIGSKWYHGCVMHHYRLLYQYCKLNEIRELFFASTVEIIDNAIECGFPIIKIAPLYTLENGATIKYCRLNWEVFERKIPYNELQWYRSID